MQTIQELEQALNDLRMRRAIVEGQLKAARELDGRAQAALVAGSGNADEAARARAKVAPLEDAKRELDTQIASVLAQIDSLKATEKRDTQRVRVLEVARKGTTLANQIEAEMEAARVELEKRCAHVAQLIQAAKANGEEFKQEFATLAGVEPHQVFSGVPLNDEAASARRQQAIAELQASSIDPNFIFAPDNVFTASAG
jgi:hypothetical protein